MKGRKSLRRAGIVLGFGALLCAGMLASGAFGMVSAISGSTDSSSTSTDTAPPTDSTSTAGTTTETSASSTSTDTTTTTTSTTETTTTTVPPPVFSPSISSDQEDYAPGATVTLTGTGWGAGETVGIFVNDDIGQSWSYTTNVTADANGGFTVQFSLSIFFIANYSVTATGASGAVARTTFTDANLRINGKDNNQHILLSNEEDLLSVVQGSSLSLTCPRPPGTGLTAAVSGNGNNPLTWSIGYGGGGADNATLSPITTLTPNTATVTGNLDTCVALSINTTTLAPGAYHGSLQLTSPGSPTALYFFRFTVTAAPTATLTVIKHVINNNGGTALASAWNMSVSGAGATPSSFAGSESGTAVTVTAGQTFTVSESGGPSGYTLTSSGNCTGPIAAGGSATCMLTNDDQAAHLVVIKSVTNDNGGSAAAGDFTMSINGVTASGGNSFPGAVSPGTDKTLTTVGSYNVTETGPSGYSGSFSAGCSGTIAVGQTKTCTVTNDDQAAHLIVIKHVNNDNGGTATAADFTLDSGGTNDTPDNFAGAESPGTNVILDAGSYSVTETGPSG
jgi:hypothetical protein